MLSNCSNKYQCHMWVGLLVKWWTTNKIGINVQVGKNCFFQVAHFIKHSNMGCVVHLPYVMTKLKSDKNLAGLIWVNKVSYAMGLEMFRIAKILQDLYPKSIMKSRSFDLWTNMNWRWFMANKFHHIQFSLQICIMLQTCGFQTIFIGLCVCPL